MVLGLRDPGGKYGNIAFNGIHLPTARFGILNMLDRKMGINPFKTDVLTREGKNRWHVAKQAREAVNNQNLPTIIAGDFNMPVESPLYRVSWDDLNNAFDSAGRGYNKSNRDLTSALLRGR